MDRSVIADVPRDKYVERCKQRALDYLDRGDLKSAVSSFVNNMDARPDCELPHHLAALGISLWMSKDVAGWDALHCAAMSPSQGTMTPPCSGFQAVRTGVTLCSGQVFLSALLPA